MKQILVVEDDREVLEGLCTALQEEGYMVRAAPCAREAERQFAEADIDLVLLDLGLPDRDGMELMRDFSQKAPELPVVILTAREGLQDRVIGLDGGAVDYILKPFALPELLARIRSHLRRSGSVEATRLQLQGLEMDLLNRTLRFQDTPVELPPREFDLLACLLRAAGQTVSREQIAREVWNSPRRMSSLDNLIDVHISRVRERLKADAPGIQLRTVRGVGYTLERV
jgi:DNA-binding response OmpR family regulator